MVHTLDQWPWSSYRAMARLCEAPPWLTIDWLLAAFSEHRSEAVRRYMDFVAEGRNQPGLWEKLKNQIFLGSDEFVVSLQLLSIQILPIRKSLPPNDGHHRNR